MVLGAQMGRIGADLIFGYDPTADQEKWARDHERKNNHHHSDGYRQETGLRIKKRFRLVAQKLPKGAENLDLEELYLDLGKTGNKFIDALNPEEVLEWLDWEDITLVYMCLRDYPSDKDKLFLQIRSLYGKEDLQFGLLDGSANWDTLKGPLYSKLSRTTKDMSIIQQEYMEGAYARKLKKQHRDAAATKIQSIGRGFSARQEVAQQVAQQGHTEAMQLQKALAESVESHGKAMMDEATQLQQALAASMNGAAARIQAVARGKASQKGGKKRKKDLQKEQEEMAAKDKRKARLKRKEPKSKEDEAAARIQAIARGKAERKGGKKRKKDLQREQEEAAAKKEAVARRKAELKKTDPALTVPDRKAKPKSKPKAKSRPKEPKSKEDEAAARIQAIARGKAERKTQKGKKGKKGKDGKGKKEKDRTARKKRGNGCDSEEENAPRAVFC